MILQRLIAPTLIGLACASPAAGKWKPANEAVVAAAKQPAVAAALAAVDRIDQSLIDDDHDAFKSLLAADLVVNNPQNGISEPGNTARRNAGGLISYVSYVRTIEYAGVRDGMVVLMGEENVVPKLANTMAGKPQRRRFTDVWREDGGQWHLALRQATIIYPR